MLGEKPDNFDNLPYWNFKWLHRLSKRKNKYDIVHPIIMMHEGVKFFPTKSDAWKFINTNEKQYVKENGELVSIEVTYDSPMPVLYRKDDDAINKDGMHFCFGEYAFVSDESCDYEFYIMECDCWIIRESDGNIRVWYPDSEETFFGKDKEIVFERVAEREE